MIDDVSRETPPAPEVARGVFSTRLPIAEAYADLLTGDGTLRGLIGPREVPRIWERHILNCAMVTELMPEHASVCDIGSGAGLPGVVIAIRRPDLHVVLVEPLLRRTTFLDEAVAVLGLANVTVHRGRAEDLHDRQEFDVVTARAVAPLERLVGWSLPLVRTGGVFLAMKGSGAHAEVEASDAALHRFGGVDVSVEVVGVGVVEPPVTVVKVVKGVPMETRGSQTKRKPRSRRS